MRVAVAPLAPAGYVGALSQLLLKLVCPGVPDIYQGAELWDRSLVDPDNRRPIDFAHRRQLLGELDAELTARGPLALAEELKSSMPDGRVKLYVTWQGHFHHPWLRQYIGHRVPIQDRVLRHPIAKIVG